MSALTRLSLAIVSKADRFGGGASRVAEQLARLLVEAGHQVDHYVAWRGGPPAAWTRPLYGRGAGRLIPLLHRLSVEAGLPELIPWEYAVLRASLGRYDMVHFHDLSTAISPLTVRCVARRVPTVWTFHDCSPFTGGCLHPLECEAFARRCGKCPALRRWPLYGKLGLDFTGFMQSIKRETARRGEFRAVAPSQWMARMALRSGMFSRPPEVIPNGVNTAVFRALDKASLRQKLGLPANRRIVLLSAHGIFGLFKGGEYALQAIRAIQDLAPFLLLMGSVDEQSRKRLAGLDAHWAGYVADPARQAEYYAAADVLLNCSIADSFSLVVLESLACGTPVVSFATGGIPEIMLEGQTGTLVPPRSVDLLVQALRQAFASDCLPAWSVNARARAEACFTEPLFLERHLALYRSVLAERAARGARGKG